MMIGGPLVLEVVSVCAGSPDSTCLTLLITEEMSLKRRLEWNDHEANSQVITIINKSSTNSANTIIAMLKAWKMMDGKKISDGTIY